MLDKMKFLEMLQSIVEIARTQDNAITKEEIKGYFHGMELDAKHYNHIYAYLGENKIEVKGYSHEPRKEKGAPKENKEDSRFLKMYLKDLKALEQLEKSQEEALIGKLISGEDAARERLMGHWLFRVVDIARGYAGRGVLLEDLIQEGNMGLLNGMENLFGSQKDMDGGGYLRESIENAIIDCINQVVANNDWKSAMVAKANLLGEAAKYLAEEYGRVATVRELSEYTRIPTEEIKDILSLSQDAIKVGKEEARPEAKVIDWSERTKG